MSDSPFAGTGSFRQRFEQGLESLLEDYSELGAWILVQANANCDPGIRARLAGPLRRKYEALAASVRSRAGRGVALDDAGDDVKVFSRLSKLGFDSIEPVQERHVGPWELQFNQLRAYRPARASKQVVRGLLRPFDPDGFHFDKPFLRKESFWWGWLAGRNVVLLYNKFPFVELHGILVPEPRAGHPQFLREADHRYVWRVTELLGETIPGVHFGFNSLGAYASVNHLHFQMFVREAPLPVELGEWRHNGGQRDYPAHCAVFGDADEAWRYIRGLHARSVSYNLLYAPGRVHCLPRRRQGSCEPAAWSEGFAWHEMTGGFTTPDHGAYETLTSAEIERELERITLAL